MRKWLDFKVLVYMCFSVGIVILVVVMVLLGFGLLVVVSVQIVFEVEVVFDEGEIVVMGIFICGIVLGGLQLILVGQEQIDVVGVVNILQLFVNIFQVGMFFLVLVV